MKRVQPLWTLLLLLLVGLALGFKGRVIGFWLALAAILGLGILGFIYRMQKK